MKQFNLWQNFLVEKVSLVGDKVYKTEWADDYIEADKIVDRFFKGLRDSQVISVTKIE